MSWFNDVWSALQGKASAVARDIGVTSNGQAIWTPRRYDMLALEGYQKNAIAYRCIDEIAKGVSQVPLVVYQRLADGNRKEVFNHPVTKLLKRPNPRQGRSQLMYEVASYLAIAGNAYMEGIGPDTGPNAGAFTELWSKRPDRMQVVPGDFGVQRYEHYVNGVTHQWRVDPVTQKGGICHVKLFHPTNDWYGLSPIEVAAMDIDTHNQTKEWNKSLLDNAARPEGGLSTDKALSDPQFNRLKKQIDVEHAGSKNAGKPILLENGLKWTQFSLSPKDMDFLESKHTSARDVCAAFGVPPMLLAIPGDNTYSNQREARVAFFDITVTFYLNLIIENLQSWLLPLDSDLELDYDLDKVPAMSLRREQMFDRANTASFLSLDEKRDMTGFDKLPENGDTVLVGTDVRPLEHAMIKEPDALEVAKASATARAAAAPKPTKPKPGGKPLAAKELDETLRSARETLGLTKDAFALWLVGEGMSEAKAAELAQRTSAPGED